jgi:glutathione S-transferase
VQTLVIHGAPGSPYVRAAVAVMVEKQLPWRLELITDIPAGLRTPSHLARHPFGRMPALEHGDFTLHETQAILRYADAIGAAPSLTPAGPREAARMNQALGIVDAYLFDTATKPIGFNRLVAPRIGLAVDEEAVAAAVPAARNCLGVLDSMLTGDYLAADVFTLADLLAATHLAMLARTGEVRAMLGELPRLAAWLARIEARPSMQASVPSRLMATPAAQGA